MISTTLFSLAKQPLPRLPQSELVAASIFLGLTVILTASLKRLVRNVEKKEPWPEFKKIKVGSELLVLFYLITVVDACVHRYELLVQYPYIFLTIFTELIHILSTIALIWGTFQLVWKEAEGQIPRFHIWWLVPRILFLGIPVFAFYYIVLYGVLAGSWLSVSYQVAPIAMQKTCVEIVLLVHIIVFGVYTVVTALYSIYQKIQFVDGEVRKSRYILACTPIFLLARSFFEIGMISKRYNTGDYDKRQSINSTYIIGFGTISCLYLVCVCLVPFAIRKFDRGSQGASAVKSDVRRWLIDTLNTRTEGGALASPKFIDLLDEAAHEMDNNILANGLSANSRLLDKEKRREARRYCRILRKRYGDLDPRQGAEKLVHPHGRRSRGIGGLFTPRKSSGVQSTKSASSQHEERRTSRTSIPRQHIRESEVGFNGANQPLAQFQPQVNGHQYYQPESHGNHTPQYPPQQQQGRTFSEFMGNRSPSPQYVPARNLPGGFLSPQSTGTSNIHRSPSTASSGMTGWMGGSVWTAERPMPTFPEHPEEEYPMQSIRRD